MINVTPIIKPHAIPYASRIFTYIDTRLGDIAERKETSAIDAVPEELIREHYVQHKDKPFYMNLVRQFAGKPVVLGWYQSEKPEVIGMIRKICGPTDPEKARLEQDNLRALFTFDSLSKAIAENRAVDNVIHSPDSLEAAVREFELWKRFLVLA